MRVCAVCGTDLVPSDAPVVPDPPIADARLGRFHPAVADGVLRLLGKREIAHRAFPRDDEVEIHVDATYREDVRAELTLTWGELLRLVDEDRRLEVQQLGGSAPGWFDAPRGGYIDRAGRLVVADDEEDSETDASRMVGPALLTAGAIAVVGGWYLVDSAALMVIGIGLVLLGLFVPR